MKYNRILLKLSGESLAGEKKQGVDAVRLEDLLCLMAALRAAYLRMGGHGMLHLERRAACRTFIIIASHLYASVVFRYRMQDVPAHEPAGLTVPNSWHLCHQDT